MAADAVVSRELKSLHEELSASQREHPSSPADPASVGAGTAPSAVLPTLLIAITPTNLTPDRLLAELRSNDPPIIARIVDGAVVLDLRTVFAEQEPAILQALERIAQN